MKKIIKRVRAKFTKKDMEINIELMKESIRKRIVKDYIKIISNNIDDYIMTKEPESMDDIKTILTKEFNIEIPFSRVISPAHNSQFFLTAKRLLFMYNLALKDLFIDKGYDMNLLSEYSVDIDSSITNTAILLHRFLKDDRNYLNTLLHEVRDGLVKTIPLEYWMNLSIIPIVIGDIVTLKIRVEEICVSEI